MDKEQIIAGVIILLIIVLPITCVNIMMDNVPDKEWKMVKKGEIEKVEYISKSGSLLSSGSIYTTFYFIDGAVVNICGRHDVYDKSCIEVYKVQNKVCWYDKIHTCDPSSL